MLKYRLRKISRKKLIIWSTMIMVFVISLGSIVGFYAANSEIVPHASNIDTTNGIVYVNDLEADWNYYESLNFTEVLDRKSMTGENRNFYNEDTLAMVQINYRGTDPNGNGWTGYLSYTEAIKDLVYYKYYPIKKDANNKEYIEIELIDNPYTKRPEVDGVMRAFNGWTCNKEESGDGVCDNSTFLYDFDYYLRYIRVYLNDSKQVVLTLNASWIKPSAFIKTRDEGSVASIAMKKVDDLSHKEDVYGYACNFEFKFNDYKYYVIDTVQRDELYTGYEVETYSETSGATFFWRLRNNYTCDKDSCSYLKAVTSGEYELGKKYFILTSETKEDADQFTRLVSIYEDGTYVVDENNEPVLDETLDENGELLYERVDYPYSVPYTRYGFKYTTYNEYNYKYCNHTDYSNVKLKLPEQAVVSNHFDYGSTLNWFYYKVNKADYSSNEYHLLYNNKGERCDMKPLNANGVATSVNCGSEVYKLVQTSDEFSTWQNRVTTNEKEEIVIENVNNVDNYYYLVTRDTNLLVYTNNSSTIYLRNNLSNDSAYDSTKPLTIMGDMSDGAKNIVGVSSDNKNPYRPEADIALENLIIQSSSGKNTGTNKGQSIVPDYVNFKISRTISFNSYQTASQIFASKSPQKYKNARYMVEAGSYNHIFGVSADYYASNGGTHTNNHLQIILGNDIDRVKGDNSKMVIHHRYAGAYGGKFTDNGAIPSTFLTIKSGTYGFGVNNAFSGIYVGTLMYGSDSSLRCLKVEGGSIHNVIGGPLFNSNVADKVVVAVYVTGGTIDNITSGAGEAETLGFRLVSVSGGKIVNAVSGGSYSTDDANGGKVDGDTLVYVGGSATLGNGGTGTYGVIKSGSVFGAGLGDDSYDSIGAVDNTHIIINLTSNGLIYGDVFGGGNFGPAGAGSSSTNTKTVIDLLRGEIKGSVYGGGNKASAGKSNSDGHSVTINSRGIKVSNIYGGSNGKDGEKAYIYGDVNINLYAGDIGSVYGGGFGYNTRVYRSVNINTDASNSGLSVDNIYGGSSFGNVNYNSGSTNVNVNGGDIENVFGGGMGGKDTNGTNRTPTTSQNINVKVNEGLIENVYGGSDQRGSLPASGKKMVVEINGGTINNVFGGSNGVNATAVGTNVSILGGTINNIYGGGNKAVTSTTNVNVDGGVIKTAVYGGGKEAAVSGSSLVNVSGGVFAEFDVNGNLLSSSEVFGGGEAATVTTTTVNIEEGANVYNVYGGSNKSGKVNNATVNNNAGTVICNTFGGGKVADVITANNNLNGTIYRHKPRPKESPYDVTCGNAFGGGANADVATANITVKSGSLLNVFGGSNAGGTVTKTNVKIQGGTIENVFGGNNQGGETINSSVEVNPGINYMSVYNVFGGSNGTGASITDSTTTNIKSGTISGDVFGGGNQAPVIKKTTVNMYGGTVGSLYGGGNRAPIGDVDTNASGALVAARAVGLTYVNVVGGDVFENVYGSGNASFVYGSTYVKVGDYAKTELKDTATRQLYIKGSVFAGSETNADASTTYDDKYEGVTGPTGYGTGLVEIDGKSYIVNDVSNLNIDGSIYGSGNNSKVVNGSNIYIKNLGTKKNPVSSTSIQRATNVYITDSHIELNGMVDRADPNSYRYSLIRLDQLNLLGSSSTTGTYLYLRQGSTFLKTFRSGKMSGDTFTPQTVTGNAGSLTAGVTDNRLYMLTNKVLSVSNSAAPIYDNTSTQAGKVKGMTYLGMYTHETGKEFVRGIYDYSYGNGSTYDSVKSGIIADSAYTFVYGLNDLSLTMDKEIKTDGFYTSIVQNEVEGESNHGKKLVYDYVGVTPANEYTLYYKWVLGYEPVEIIVDLIADKYSESGAVNALISLEELRETITNADGSTTSQEWRDAILTIQSVDTTNFGATTADATRAFDGLLVDKADIPTVNTDDKNNDGVVDANNYFALSMGTTSTGWLDNYKTNFYDNDYAIDNNFCSVATGNCNGNQIYQYDSTTKQRNLSFWLYHSKNLDFSYVDKLKDPTNMLIPMNSVYIDVEFRNPHGDPTSTSSTQPVRITVNISLSDGELDKYGGVIAPGKKYEMFQGRPTTIAANGSFSVYQSLSLDLTKTIAGSATGEKWDVGKIYHQAKTVDVVDAYGDEKTVEWSKSYRYLASSYLLPVGTVITMLDLKNNEQYYYEVTQDNYNQKATEYGDKKEYKYFLTDFVRMGSTTDTNKFDDDMNEEASTKYYYKDEMSELAVEEFVFSVDFAGANVQVQNPDGDQYYFFLQLAREEDGVEKTIVSTNGTPTSEMIYTLKPQVSSKISTEGGYVQEDGSITNDTTIYVGESTQLSLDTTLIQLDENGNLLLGVSDTKFDDYKLGAKITVKRPKLDKDGNIVYDDQNNVVYEDVTSDLFGTVMEINGRTYYPQTDGSTRLELAGRITDVLSNINIDFSNSSLTYGEYVLVVETFVSYDGLYYGDFEATRNEFPFELLNNQYGLDVKTETPTQVTHDVNTGEDANGDREIHYLVNSINGLANPNLKISIERRDYSSFYETNYQLIPVTNIVEEIRVGESTENIITAQNTCFAADTDGNCFEYNLGTINNDSVITTYDVYVKLKNGPDVSDLGNNKPNSKWKSGTYRVIYSLYDGDVKVGDFYEYLIIRSLGVNEVVIEGSGK